MPENLIDSSGRRLDGRTEFQLRPIKITPGAIKGADGSAYIEWGANKLMAAVYGPRELYPKNRQDPMRAVIQCRYSMAAFSVPDRRRPGPDRRAIEISKLISEVFAGAVFCERFPRTAIDIHIDVLESNAGARCAAVAAASVALADAGIPMRGLVSACAVGKAGGRLIVDLDKDEDSNGECDMPAAFLGDDIVMLQLDGELAPDELAEALRLAKDACAEVLEAQRASLVRNYVGQGEEDDAPAQHQPVRPVPEGAENPNLASRDIREFIGDDEQ